MLRRVVSWKFTDVLEVLAAPIIRVMSHRPDDGGSIWERQALIGTDLKRGVKVWTGFIWLRIRSSAAGMLIR
jgi:hypothetical protein